MQTSLRLSHAASQAPGPPPCPELLAPWPRPRVHVAVVHGPASAPPAVVFAVAFAVGRGAALAAVPALPTWPRWPLKQLQPAPAAGQSGQERRLELRPPTCRAHPHRERPPLLCSCASWAAAQVAAGLPELSGHPAGPLQRARLAAVVPTPAWCSASVTPAWRAIGCTRASWPPPA